MAFALADRVRETSVTNGLGALALAGALATFQRFSAVYAVADTLYYAIVNRDVPGEWEIGLGTYSAANQLTRTTVLSSSNANAAVNFSAGTKDVTVAYPASKAVVHDSNGDVAISRNLVLTNGHQTFTGSNASPGAGVRYLGPSGSANNLTQNVATGNKHVFAVNDTGVSYVNSSGLFATTDNAVDLGASGANRFRDLFLARNGVIGGTLTMGGTLAMGANGITGVGTVAGVIQWRMENDDTGTTSTAQFLMQNSVGTLFIKQTSTGFTATGAYPQNGAAIVADTAGGMSLGSIHASGTTRLWSGNAVAVTFDASQQASLTGNLIASTDNTKDIGASGATRFRDLFLARNAVIGGTIDSGGTITATATNRGLNINATNANGAFVAWQQNGSDEFYIGKSAAVGGGGGYDIYAAATKGITFFTNATQAVAFKGNQTVQMLAYGAGAATFDAAGNISSVSDERLKEIEGYETAGLEAVRKLNPIRYRWNEQSGMEREQTYLGFSAQNARSAHALTVGRQADGMLTLQDRAILALTVLAVKEIDADTTALLKWRDRVAELNPSLR